MEFDKITVGKIADEMRDAVQVVANRHGIKIERCGGSFESLQAILKFRLTTVSSDGDTKESRDFKEFASSYGLRSTDLGKEFKLDGNIARIVGLQLKRRKCPVVVEFISTKKRVLITPDYAKHLVA